MQHIANELTSVYSLGSSVLSLYASILYLKFSPL